MAPPTTMRRLVLAEPSPAGADPTSAKLLVEEVPVPVPKSGEVLVKMAAAPVNPSDYGVWRNTAASKCPVPIGNEGSGVVVATGGGLSSMLWASVGTKVGVTNIGKGQGSFSEYVCVDASTSCFPMPDSLNVEAAASFFVNPYTVAGILDTTAAVGSPGLVHTAAASQVGQMLVKLCKQRRVALINVVRREEQAEKLRALGAEHIVVTAADGWEAQLEGLIKELKVTAAFDAISGDMAGTLVKILPRKGTLFTYGGLSAKPVGGISPIDLIYHEKQVKGWFLGAWVRSGGLVAMLGRLRWTRKLVNPGLAPGGWAESRFVDCTLDGAKAAFDRMFESGFTDTKLRIRFEGASEAPAPPV